MRCYGHLRVHGARNQPDCVCLHLACPTLLLLGPTVDVWDAVQRDFTGKVEYQGESIDLGSPFRRASMADLVKEVHFRVCPAGPGKADCILPIPTLPP